MIKSLIRDKYISLRTKFIVFFLFFITVPIAVSGTITYTKYASNVERSMADSTSQLVEQIRINLDRYIQEIERLTLSPFYDEEVLAILKKHSGAYDLDDAHMTIEEQQKINLFISSMAFDRSEIESILLFSNDGSLFNNS